MANGWQNKISGVVTRSRTTVNGLEKSTIDFVIVSSELVDHIESIVIDEDKVNCLSSNVRTKKGVKVTKSDHNSIIKNFKVMWKRD